MENRILFFTGGMGRGGAERVITLLSEQYIKKGWKVSIAMVLHNLVEYQIPEGVELIPLADKNDRKLGAIGTCIRIRKYVDKFQPTVIVSFLSAVCILVDLSLGKTKIPILMSERIDPYMANRNPLFSFAVKRAYSHADIFVAQTQKAKSYFSDEIQKKTAVIPNPIRVAAYRVTNREKRIVTAGRLTRQKNHKMLIKAFSHVHDKHPEYSLDIYGEGELRTDLEKLIQDVGLSDYVSLRGAVSDLHDQIKTSEIFVLSSDYEGLSNAFLEAMMMGLPVIATNCAGCDEVIENGKNGLLIKVGDQNGLVEALNTLIENEEYRNVIAENGQKSVQRFQVDAIIQTWEQVISSCIRG